MTTAEWLASAEKKLIGAEITTARLDALVLLEDTIKKDRAWILANLELNLNSTQIQKLNKLLTRRVSHQPLAYLRGKTEFYGREFIVTPAVLVPRPESETMIECILKLPKSSKRYHLADVGSGSGALGITAALEMGDVSVDLLEIDPQAAEVSQINVAKYTLGINVIKSDLLGAARQDYDILLCNLPYVPDDYPINRAAKLEPKLAIFGGSDGLEVYRKLFKQLRNQSNKPLFILTESLPLQHDAITTLAASVGYSQKTEDDFIQVFSLLPE